MRGELAICANCGRKFITKGTYHKHCSEECRKEYGRKKLYEKHKRPASAGKEGRTCHELTLAEANAAAKAAGMTYRQLQKQETIQQLRESGFWERKKEEKS